MSKSPAFQFYARDWLASSTVKRMPREVQADYFTLLCYQAMDGNIPANPGEIRTLLGLSAKEWAKSWKYLEPQFPLCPDGTRRNPRQSEVIEEREAFLEAKRSAGKKGAISRWQTDGRANSTPDAKPMAQPIANAWPASASASASPPESTPPPTQSFPSTGSGAAPPENPGPAPPPGPTAGSLSLSEKPNGQARTPVPMPVPDERYFAARAKP